MTIPKEAWPLVGAICAAIIGGAASFIVTMLSKEQKTSEFRQAWIDGLREDLANFGAVHSGIIGRILFWVDKGQELQAVLEKSITADRDTFEKIDIARLRILLRLNPAEHGRLIKRLNDVYAAASVEELEKASPRRSHGLLIEAFVEESQKVLKAEWRRVKRGEMTFRVTKWLSALCVILALLIALTNSLHKLGW